LEVGLWTQNDGKARRELVSEIINEARRMTGGLVGFSNFFVIPKHQTHVDTNQLLALSLTLTTAPKHQSFSVFPEN